MSGLNVGLERRKAPPRIRIAAAATVLAALAAPTHATDPTYALHRVETGAGALPVRGSDGILFEQTFGPSCELRSVPAAQESLAFAGIAGSQIELEVTAAGCPLGAPEPSVRCAWKAAPAKQADASCRRTPGPATSGTARWTGRRHQIAVDVPATTGLYEFTLSCTLPGREPTALRRQLFVSRSRPLYSVTPPATSWYERATCWAAGFEAGGPELAVLEALLRGIYVYGHGNWLYGYSHRAARDVFKFPLVSNGNGRSLIEYKIDNPEFEPFCTDGRRYCKCVWQAMVDPEAVCDFADCFVFSDVFQNIAAVLGIGGMEAVRIDGATGLGFATISGIRSFDPDFPGNIRCGTESHSPECFPYFFGAHSLRERDGLYYDATFDRTYTSPDEPIALNRDRQIARVVEFLASLRIMLYLRPGYGSWPYYHGPPGLTLADLPPPEPPPVEPSGPPRFIALDLDVDGYFDALEVRLDAEIYAAGEYLFQAFLTKDGETVANQATWDSAYPTVALLDGDPGQSSLRFRFSGNAIFNSGLDRPYEVVINDTFGNVWRFVDDACHGEEPDRRSCDYRNYSETAASIADVTPADLVEDGDRILRAVAGIQVRDRGTFVLEGRLARLRSGGGSPAARWETLGYAGTTFTLRARADPPPQEVALSFPCREFAKEDSTAWKLTVVLYDAEQSRAIDDRSIELETFCLP